MDKVVNQYKEENLELINNPMYRDGTYFYNRYFFMYNKKYINNIEFYIDKNTFAIVLNIKPINGEILRYNSEYDITYRDYVDLIPVDLYLIKMLLNINCNIKIEVSKDNLLNHNKIRLILFLLIW